MRPFRFLRCLPFLTLPSCSDPSPSAGEIECLCLGAVDAGAGRGDAGSDAAPADAGASCTPGPSLRAAWTSDRFDGCLLASLLRHDSEGRARVIAVSGDGRVSALDAATGAVVWDLALPEQPGELAYIVATPVIVGSDRLVLTWQDIAQTAGDPATAPRSAHRAAVVDLTRGQLDPAYPILTLAGERPAFDGSGNVLFQPNNALSRASLVHLPAADGGPGFVYVGLGNARDIQPWHGWLFELDLLAWKESGSQAAISGLLLTSPENSCEPEGQSGSRDMNCGAGIWAPAGPELVMGPDGQSALLVPTGNGALDMNRADYAHTVMRISIPGLSFDDGCDPALCAAWDVLSPSQTCMESCSDLFIPRLLPGSPPLDQPDCETLSFFGCYARHDLDLGANTPAEVTIPGGPKVLVLPAKDGSVYLFDADHLGTLYDRLPLVAGCGSDGAHCTADWAGSMVTRAEITSVDGMPFAVIGTFQFDDVHPAGLFGVRIVLRDGRPALERAWQAPSPDSNEALQSFRNHASRVRLVNIGGTEYALVVDPRDAAKLGHLWLVRVSDGALASKRALGGPGQRFAQPLVIGDQVFVASCLDGNRGPGHVESWAIEASCP